MSDQVRGRSDLSATYAPAGVPTNSESWRMAMALIWLLANGDTVPRSGIEPASVVPFHSARPRVVPIHTVSPWGAMVSAESEGRPSNVLISDQRPSVSSRLTPLPGTAANRFPLRSIVIAWMVLPARPFGSRVIDDHVLSERRKLTSPAS